MPLSVQVRVSDPSITYPLSQKNLQVCPGRLEQGCMPPLKGADSCGQRFTEKRKEHQKFINLYVDAMYFLGSGLTLRIIEFFL